MILTSENICTVDIAKYHSPKSSYMGIKSRIRDLFNMSDMGHYWVAQDVANENHFLKIFRKRLQDFLKKI